MVHVVPKRAFLPSKSVLDRQNFRETERRESGQVRGEKVVDCGPSKTRLDGSNVCWVPPHDTRFAPNYFWNMSNPSICCDLTLAYFPPPKVVAKMAMGYSLVTGPRRDDARSSLKLPFSPRVGLYAQKMTFTQ